MATIGSARSRVSGNEPRVSSVLPGNCLERLHPILNRGARLAVDLLSPRVFARRLIEVAVHDESGLLFFHGSIVRGATQFPESGVPRDGPSGGAPAGVLSLGR